MGFWIFGKKKKKEIKETKIEEKVVETKNEDSLPTEGKDDAKIENDTTTKTTEKADEIKKEKTAACKKNTCKDKDVIKSEVSEEKTRKAPSKKVYHVSLRKEDGKWQVKYGGGKKAIKLFDTQAEAIKFAEERADSQEGSISIHKKDGKIRKQDYSKKAEDKESK